jgi:FixJ family two-component response regulator
MLGYPFQFPSVVQSEERSTVTSRRHGLRVKERSVVLSKLPLVAIIDDDASVRVTTDSLVRSLGYRTHTFASAEEFVGSNRSDDLSCVIADVQMPGMSGVELQAHLRSQGSRVPFIFFTAFPDEKIRAQAFAAGAICYLIKPFDVESFVLALQAALKAHDGGAGRVRSKQENAGGYPSTEWVGKFL